MWEIILGSRFQRPLESLISVTVRVGAAWPFVLYWAIVVVRRETTAAIDLSLFTSQKE